jgi:hypothetical protein
MLVDTTNRMARGMNFPSLVGPNSIALVTDIAAPGTAFQNASYGMAGYPGTLRNRAGLGDFTVLGDYFTSTNYYLGFVVLGLAGFALLKGFGPNKKERARKAAIIGKIAREKALL